jgi:hypothetical protein
VDAAVGACQGSDQGSSRNWVNPWQIWVEKPTVYPIGIRPCLAIGINGINIHNGISKVL